MASPPAKCKNARCGHIFPATAFQFSNSFGITFENCSTNCPRCGSRADIGDGVYNMPGNSIELVNGPPLTAQMMSQLDLLVSQVKAGVITAEEFLPEIAGVSPEFAKKIRDRGLLPFASILFIIWLLKGVSLDIKIDINRLIDQAREVNLERSDRPINFDDDNDIPAPDFEHA
jgi:hypothetical protein